MASLDKNLIQPRRKANVSPYRTLLQLFIDREVSTLKSWPSGYCASFRSSTTRIKYEAMDFC